MHPRSRKMRLNKIELLTYFIFLVCEYKISKVDANKI